MSSQGGTARQCILTIPFLSLHCLIDACRTTWTTKSGNSKSGWICVRCGRKVTLKSMIRLLPGDLALPVGLHPPNNADSVPLCRFKQKRNECCYFATLRYAQAPPHLPPKEKQGASRDLSDIDHERKRHRCAMHYLAMKKRLSKFGAHTRLPRPKSLPNNEVAVKKVSFEEALPQDDPQANDDPPNIRRSTRISTANSTPKLK